jgi:uncharacterized membrane protein YfcA
VLLLGFLLALLVGLSLGLLGGGGSILAVPIFVYVLGFSPKESIAMSLAVVGATSLVGAIRHGRGGNLNLRVALIFGPFAMGGAYLGARLAASVSGAAQLALFAIVMLLAAVFMFRDRPPRRSRRLALERPVLALALIVLEGLAVGVLTGLVGVGGGFLIVPALVLLTGLPMKEAVGTSLLIIAMNSGAGFAGYLPQVEVEWAFMAGFASVAVAGIWVGTHLVRYVSPRALRRAFAVFLLVMGAWILYSNRSALHMASAADRVLPSLTLPGRNLPVPIVAPTL